MPRVKKVQLPSIPVSHLEALHEAGFDVLRYQNVAIEVQCEDGSKRKEWLPEDFLNWELKRFVRWCQDDKYDFSGWEPQEGHSFGGRYHSPAEALAWFVWRDSQR